MRRRVASSGFSFGTVRSPMDSLRDFQLGGTRGLRGTTPRPLKYSRSSEKSFAIVWIGLVAIPYNSIPLIIFSHLETKLLRSGTRPGREVALRASLIETSRACRVRGGKVSRYSMILPEISDLDILSKRCRLRLGRTFPAKSDRSLFIGKNFFSLSMLFSVPSNASNEPLPTPVFRPTTSASFQNRNHFTLQGS